MLSKIQNKALHHLAKRNINKFDVPSPVGEAFESLEMWFYFNPWELRRICIICFESIECSCQEPHPGKQHKPEDILEEHGIKHLKEHNLLPFL